MSLKALTASLKRLVALRERCCVAGAVEQFFQEEERRLAESREDGIFDGED